MAIRVAGPDHLPVVVQHVFARAEGNGEIVIKVDPGARLSGTVRPLAALRQLGLAKRGNRFDPRNPTVELTLVEGSGRRRRATTHLAADGSFQFAGLAPGTWKICMRTSPGAATSPRVADLASVELGVREHRTLEFDLGAATGQR